MSRTQPTDSNWAQMQFGCPTCGAARGEWCTAVRGQAALRGDAAKWLHCARWRAVREVIRLAGWEQWLDDERTRAAQRRREIVALSGGLIALRGELEQVTARGPDLLVAPGPIIHRIDTILTTAKETQ